MDAICESMVFFLAEIVLIEEKSAQLQLESWSRELQG
jgi:hypothetical protein